MKIDGQCHCGAIAYEAEVYPDSIRICHCTDCQQLSGSPFRANISELRCQFTKSPIYDTQTPFSSRPGA